MRTLTLNDPKKIEDLHSSTFLVSQMFEIKSWLKDNLDISCFIDSDFNIYQMYQIRLGLKDNLDVSIYANSKYNWKQMYYLKLIKNVKNDIKHKEIYN